MRTMGKVTMGKVFKIDGVRFTYTSKYNDGMRDVKMFSTDYNARITIGKVETIQGAREFAENFMEGINMITEKVIGKKPNSIILEDMQLHVLFFYV